MSAAIAPPPIEISNPAENDNSAASFYVTGGTVPTDAASYVTRLADTDLRDGLTSGEFCYLLNTRQMGKSSLCVRTMNRLIERGARTVFIDLTRIGGQTLTAEQWYAGLLSEIGRNLNLRREFLAYWKANTEYGLVQRLFGALREIALETTEDPIVIFIDEIDATRSLTFSTDEFFAAIRECHNRRILDPIYKRLTFCLLGVATPADLISDTRLSPFNVGRRIELRDFTTKEAAPLGAHLPGGQRTLDRVLYWTGGHPYLTQRFCRHLSETKETLNNREIDRVCSDLFLSRTARDSDDNIAFVRNRLLRSEADIAALLDLYRQVRRGGNITDDETNPLCAILRLSGVAKVENGKLRVRNRIYDRVFDNEWVNSHMPDAELRRQKAAYQRGIVRAATLAAFVVLAMAVLSIVAVRNARRAAQNERIARQNAESATANAARADSNAQKAEANAQTAQKNADLAQSEAKKARLQTELATAADTRSRKLAQDRQTALDAQKNALVERQDALDQALKDRTRADRNADNARKSAGLAHSEAERAGRETVRANGAAMAAQHNAYAATMAAIQQAWDENNIGRVRDLLHTIANSPDRNWEWAWWQQQCHQEQKTFYGHDGGVDRVVWAANGKFFITSGEDRTIRFWNPRTGSEMRRITVHHDIQDIALSPKGDRLLVGIQQRGHPHLYDTATGDRVALLDGDEQGAGAVDWSADGRRMAFGSADGTVTVKDAASLHTVSQTKFSVQSIRRVALSPDGSRMAIGGDNGKVFLCATDGADRKAVEFKGQQKEINAVAFSPDGKQVAAAGSDATVSIWKTESGKEEIRLQSYLEPILATVNWRGDRFTTSQVGEELRGHRAPAFSLAWSPDGTSILTGGRDTTAVLWNTTTGKVLRVLRGHTAPIQSVAYSPDGSTFLTVGENIRLWNSNGDTRDILPVEVDAQQNANSRVAVSPDGRRIALLCAKGIVHVVETATGHLLATIDTHSAFNTALAFLPDSRRLAYAGSEGYAKWTLLDVYDTDTGQNLAHYRADTAAIKDMQVLSENKLLLTTTTDDLILWDGKSQRLLRTLTHSFQMKINLSTLSPDKGTLLVGGMNGRIEIWDTHRLIRVGTLNGHSDMISALRFSGDGNYLLTASYSGTVNLWDWRTRRIIRTITLAQNLLSVAALSPDAQRLAVGCTDGKIRLWDTRSGALLVALSGQNGGISDLEFLPDGKTLVSCGADGTLHIWRSATDRQIADWEEVDRKEAARLAKARRNREQVAKGAALRERTQLQADVLAHRVGGYPTTAAAQAVNLAADTIHRQNWYFHVQGGTNAAGDFLLEPNGIVHLTVRGLGQSTWHIHANYHRFDLVAGKPYILQFRARADRRRTIVPNVQNDVSPYITTGAGQDIEVANEWRYFQFSFVAHNGAVPKSGALVFQVGNALGTVEIADIMLVPDIRPDND